MAAVSLVGVGLAAPTSAAPADSASATADPPGVTVTSDGWIHYPSLLGRVGATGTQTTVKGARDASGACTSSSTVSTAAGDVKQRFSEEVAYNPATCESTVVESVVTPNQLTQIQSITGTSTVASSADTATSALATTATAQAAAATTYARYLKTSWIDPINITISSQKVGLRWTSSNWSNWAFARDSFKGCVGSVCLDKTYIVSGSQGLSGVTNGWKFTSNVHFRNTSFALWVVGVLGAGGWAACGFPTSSQADFYHTDSVTGLKNGGSSWSWNDTKSGACTNLVHHGSQTGASYPF